MTPAVRLAAPADWASIEALCGADVPAEERADFARHWIAPYRTLRPDWSYVAEDGGVPVAYLTGCPDSLAFEKERRRTFDPPPDSRDFFPMVVRLKLWMEHPAHLHLTVAEKSRGRGAGSALVRVFLSRLRREGIPSCHVFAGPATVSYWERMAFRAEAVVEAAPGVVLRAMTRPSFD